MDITLEELQQRLDTEVEPYKQLETLDQLCGVTHYNNPQLAYEYATRILHIAESFNDKYWIARAVRARAMYEGFFTYRDPDSMLEQLAYAARLFQEIGNEIEQTKVLFAMATHYEDKGEYIKAKATYEQCLVICRKPGCDNIYCGALYHLGIIEREMGRLPQSMQILLEALNLSQKIQHTYLEGSCYNTIAGIYMDINELEKALEYYTKAVVLSQILGQKMVEAITLANIGSVYAQMGQLDQALKNYKYAQELFHELKRFDNEACVWGDIGQIYKQYSYNQQALECYQQALELLQAVNNNKYNSPIYQGIAEIYIKEEQYRTAKKYLDLALKEAIAMDKPIEQYQIYKQLTDMYVGMRKMSKALECHKKYAEIRETVLDQEKQRAIAEMQAKFDVQTAERDKELLQVKNIDLTNALEEVRCLNERLMQLNNEKNEMLDVVAHDLKSPLSGIQLVSALLKEYHHQMSTQELEDRLDTIARTSEQMLTIATNLLRAQTLENGGLHDSIEHVDVLSVLSPIVERYREMAGRKNITLDYELPSEEITIQCNSEGLQQVMENLVSNAVKFTPSGKWVGIRVWRNKKVYIEVADEGPGINRKDRSRLYEKFARLSACPTGGEHSTGLGLWIVKKTVEKMRGNIRCISKPGKGTRFVVALIALD